MEQELLTAEATMQVHSKAESKKSLRREACCYAVRCVTMPGGMVLARPWIDQRCSFPLKEGGVSSNFLAATLFAIQPLQVELAG